MSQELNFVRTGEAAWMMLRTALLSPEGKKLVSSDPSLSEPTMQALLALYDGKVNPCQFFFGDDELGDISLTTLSMCIKDNKQASLGELVARYAELRNLPFLETAIAVIELRKSKGLFYYDKEDRMIVRKRWLPQISANHVRPPKKRALAI